MKYRCKMCGYEGEGDSLPTTDCPSCGMEDGWESKPFDARCPKCGQGYYESEKPDICPNCGYRIAAPEPSATIKKAPAKPKKRRGAAARKPPASATSASISSGGVATPHSSLDGFDSKKFFKVLACVVGITIVCWLGYYAVAWIWDVLGFIARHWIIFLVILFVIIGAAEKN